MNPRKIPAAALTILSLTLPAQAPPKKSAPRQSVPAEVIIEKTCKKVDLRFHPPANVPPGDSETLYIYKGPDGTTGRSTTSCEAAIREWYMAPKVSK